MNTRLNVIVLHTADLNAARTYYTGTLGFQVAQEHPGNVLEFRGTDGAELALMQVETAQVSAPFSADLWFIVPDVGAYHAQVTAAGANVVRPPEDGPFGRAFTLTTPDGHALTFHEAQAGGTQG